MPRPRRDRDFGVTVYRDETETFEKTPRDRLETETFETENPDQRNLYTAEKYI